MKNFLSAFSLFITCIALHAQTATYKEQYRPQFHFSPAINWTNDPNGLVYNNGEYHIFYQHNPFENKWGHMTWGHAVSKDLVHWQHLPVAIKEENGIMIFSGTCVVDKNNTSGFGQKNGPAPMIAIYTGHTDTIQSQHLAYSLDNGRTWTKYKNNPILNLHKKDFRDPKVFWYAKGKYWVMAVVLPQEHKVQFYHSKNLLHWDLLSEFGPAGDTTGIWECPDLFQVPVADDPLKNKWVLTMSISTAMQYFAGEFDGVVFTNENPADKIYRPDYGPDFYAGITYNNLPILRKPVMIAWANNWEYANDIPTKPWKSAMTLPRVFSLSKLNSEWLLRVQPLEGVEKLREKDFMALESHIVNGNENINLKSQQFEMELDIQPSSNGTSGVKLAVGNNHYAEVGYNSATQKLYLDRSNCANQSFNKNFANLFHFETPLNEINGHIKLRVFFDNSIIEVFANDGLAAMTMQVFPDAADKGITLFSNNGSSFFSNVKIWKMKSAWE